MLLQKLKILVAKDGVVVQAISRDTLMFINHNRRVIDRHSSVSHKERNIIRHLKTEFCDHLVKMEVKYWVTSNTGVC